MGKTTEQEATELWLLLEQIARAPRMLGKDGEAAIMVDVSLLDMIDDQIGLDEMGQ